MPETSIIDAKIRLTSLIHQAEAGEPVHLTRRVKRVAVIVSEAQFEQIVAAEAMRSGVWQHGWGEFRGQLTYLSANYRDRIE